MTPEHSRPSLWSDIPYIEGRWEHGQPVDPVLAALADHGGVDLDKMWRADWSRTIKDGVYHYTLNVQEKPFDYFVNINVTEVPR